MLTIFYGSFSHAGQSFIIAATPKGICFVGSPDGTISELTTFLPQTKLVANQAAIAPYSESLTAYLDGDQTTWSLPIDIIGGTPFQRSVWTALQAVPYGSNHNLQRFGGSSRAPHRNSRSGFCHWSQSTIDDYSLPSRLP